MRHTIVFADNERGVRRFCKEELESAGYCIMLAEDGADAIETVNQFTVDAVVLDEHMPRCSGLEAARRIKQEHQELPVILFTADPDYEGFHSPLIDAAVLKTADLSELIKTLEGLLAQRTVTAPARSEKPSRDVSFLPRV